jgi:oligopeptide transport system substrate-binding protein
MNRLPTTRRALLAGTASIGAAASLGACSNGTIIGFDKAKRSLDIANTGEPLSLDPQKCSGTWENNIVGNMFMGLVQENENAEPIPGMAERWETSEDGLTWTFYLRPATWSDGERCDAHDFVFAYRRILDPATLAEYASILYIIKNAQAVNQGRLPPVAVGVAALADNILEIQLENPAPYLLQLLKHYTNYPVPKHVIERVGDDWIKPENIVVNGAFKLEKWWSNYIVHLTKNPNYVDAAHVELEHLYFYPSTNNNTAARSVLSGERGWSSDFPSNLVDELRRDLPGFVRVAPYLLMQCFFFNNRRPPFDDVRVRRALSMSFDRDFVANHIYKTGDLAAYSLVPPGIANYEANARYAWSDQPMEARRAEAKRLLEEAGYGPDKPLRFELSHRVTRDNPRVAVVAQSDWRSIAPWIVVELVPTETQIHYANMRAHNFDAGDGGWSADYNDARTYLYLFETRTGPQNYCGYSNPAFDRLMAESDLEPDVAKRAALMSQAEQLVLDDAAACTTTFITSKNLVNPDLTGWQTNLEDIHRARWFGIRNA